MKRFIATNAATGAIWYGLSHVTETGDRFTLADKVIVTEIAVTCVLASVVMVAGTRTWSARALGLWQMLTGIAVLYGAVWYTYFISSDVSIPKWARDLGRSLLLVGCLLLVFGLTSWVWEHWRTNDDPISLDPEWDGKTERRAMFDRRRDWGRLS